MNFKMIEAILMASNGMPGIIDGDFMHLKVQWY